MKMNHLENTLEERLENFQKVSDKEEIKLRQLCELPHGPRVSFRWSEVTKLLNEIDRLRSIINPGPVKEKDDFSFENFDSN